MRVRRWLPALSIIVLAEVVSTGGCLNFMQPQYTAEQLCNNAGGAFYCQTNIVPQDQVLNSYGHKGYCMIGTGTGGAVNIGYSGVTGNGGATPVFPTSQGAWDMCTQGGLIPSACSTVVRCTHQ